MVESIDSPDTSNAALALLAFWRWSGVDMDEAEAVFTAPAPSPQPAAAPVRKAARKPAPEAPVELARKLATEAQTITELRRVVEGFDGCTLKATARNTVFSDGIEDAKILLIGEAPGRDEDERGKPFVGRSGQLLDRMLAAIGLSRKTNTLISNTIYWRPPGNRDPTPGEAAVCMPFAERLIELVQPRMLILVGKVAAQSVLRREDSVTRMRGRRLIYAPRAVEANKSSPTDAKITGQINAMVMLHPAYLLRRPQDKSLAWADLQMLEAWLQELAPGLLQPPATGEQNGETA